MTTGNISKEMQLMLQQKDVREALIEGYFRFNNFTYSDLISENINLRNEIKQLKSQLENQNDQATTKSKSQVTNWKINNQNANNNYDDYYSFEFSGINLIPKDIISIISKYIYMELLCWDDCINNNKIEYSDYNQLAKCKVTKDGHLGHITIKTKYFDNGNHTIILKIENAIHVGIGIIDKDYSIEDINKWIGSDSHSYGHWNNVYVMHNRRSLIEYLIDKNNVMPTHTGMIVKINLNLGNVNNNNKKQIPTFSLNCNDKKLTKDIPITFSGNVAIVAALCNRNEAVRIVDYIKHE